MQELSDKLETSNVVLSGVVNAQNNGTCIPSEDKTCQNTKMVSYNDSVTQATLNTAYDGPSESTCQKSVLDNLENKVDNFHPSLLIKTGAVQDVIQHRSLINNECQPSMERREEDVDCMMESLEPVTLAFEKNANVPTHTEVNTADKPTGFNTELVKQVSPALSIQYTMSALEKVQTQSSSDVPSLAMSEFKDNKSLSASSVRKETPPESLCLLQKEIPPLTSSADEGSIMEALELELVKSCSSLASDKTKCPQDASLQTQNGLNMSLDEDLEPSQVKVVSSTSITLREQQSPNCIPVMSDVAGGSSEIMNSDNSSLNQEKILQTFNSVFPKQTDLSLNREEVSMELSGEDADIDLTLTVSPPTSPSEEIATGEIEQLQRAPVSNVGQENRCEEMVEPEQESLIKNRETNSASCMSVYPVEPREPLKICTSEVTEKVNDTSDFPFGPLIEVSPASSPDPIVQTRDRQSSPCCLKLHGSQSEKTNKFFQVKSGDLTIPEKESCLVGPKSPKGQDMLAQVQAQLSAEMPQIPTNAEVEGRVTTVPGKVNELSVPSEHEENLSFSEMVPCYDIALNKPTSPAKYGGNFKPLEKPVKAGNSLEADCMENRNVEIKHLALESSVPSCSPRKVENKSSTDTLLSITTSGIMNMSLKQTSSKNIKKNVCDSDVKTEADSNLQAGTVSSASIDKTDVQAYFHPEISAFVSSSDSVQCTCYTKPVSVEPGFQTQEIPVVRMASLLKNIGTELHEERMDLSAIGLQSNSMSTKDEQKTIHVLQDTMCEVKEFLNGDIFSQNADSCQKSISEEPSASFVPEFVDSVCDVYKEHTFGESPSTGHETKVDAETLSRDTEISVNVSTCCGPHSGDCVQDSLDCKNCKFDVENLRGNHPSQKDAIKDSCDSFTGLNNSDDTWACSSKISALETHIPPRNQETEPHPVSPDNKCMPRYVQIPDSHGVPKTYANFTITKEFKDTTRRLHSLKRHRNLSANCDLLSSWTGTWHVTDDLTRNTLDLEYLRFDHKLKQIIKKGDSQQSSPSNIFPKETLIQISVGTVPSTQTSEASGLHLPLKSRSPILVTVVHPDTRQQSHHRRGCSPSSLDSSYSFWKEKWSQSKNLKNSERSQTVPFHLNKLKYNSTLKESRNDISLILNEYAEFNKVMMNSNQIVFQDKELNVASAEAVSQETYQPRKSVSYKDVITDLCATLHVKLKGVMREACKSPFLFYLVETEDKSFLLRTKVKY